MLKKKADHLVSSQVCTYQAALSFDLLSRPSLTNQNPELPGAPKRRPNSLTFIIKFWNPPSNNWELFFLMENFRRRQLYLWAQASRLATAKLHYCPDLPNWVGCCCCQERQFVAFSWWQEDNSKGMIHIAGNKNDRFKPFYVTFQFGCWNIFQKILKFFLIPKT